MNNTVPKLIELVKPINPNQYGKFKRKLMEHLFQEHKLLSIPTKAPRNVANVGGERAYMLIGSLAKLERALSNWTMNELITKHKFEPVVVPNIIYDDIIEKCGFPTKSDRSQVFKISADNKQSILDDRKNSLFNNSENVRHSCLAGTSEFALASIHIGDTINFDDLPKRYCALSRCYRAETSNSATEWGIYRVRYFNKVEMFSFTMPDKSDLMHKELLNIQRDLFSQLDLKFQILDMPKDELGLSAIRKFDIEAWMEGRQRFGEISSTSNCTDYQSSRLNIKYSQMIEDNGQLKIDTGYVHTVNGTACSTIRTIIALIEQHQTEEGQVMIPKPLVPFMGGIKSIPTAEDRVQLNSVDLYPIDT